jgi:hypothetical protein
MITKILTYKNGHFYDKITKERLEIKEGIDFSITCAGNDDFFKAKPAGKYPLEPLAAKELKAQIDSDSNISKYKRVYERGKRLYFEIARLESENPVNHVFEIELLEELYLYYNNSWKLKEYRLYDCCCQLIGNPSETLDFFEWVYGKSLNELFKNTFVHYFGNKGNPASNALDRFYEINNKGKQVYVSSFRGTVEGEERNMRLNVTPNKKNNL